MSDHIDEDLLNGALLNLCMALSKNKELVRENNILKEKLLKDEMKKNGRKE